MKLSIYGKEIIVENDSFFYPDPSVLWCTPRGYAQFGKLLCLSVKGFEKIAEKGDLEEQLQKGIVYVEKGIAVREFSEVAQKQGGYDYSLEQSEIEKLQKTIAIFKLIIEELQE